MKYIQLNGGNRKQEQNRYGILSQFMLATYSEFVAGRDGRLLGGSGVGDESSEAEVDPFKVFTISRTNAPVRARAGLLIHPDYHFQNHPAIDIIIIPGGVATQTLSESEVIRWIVAAARAACLTASVCTGAFLLAQADLLTGKSATTHWEDIDDLKEMFPSIKVQTNKRWIDESTVITSAGISVRIDMSLHIVERMAGRDLALRTARQLEFDWRENT